MNTPATLPDLEEALRLDALERQQITDTPRDPAFDHIVQMACAALEAPVGAISFLESDRLWVKAGQGIGAYEMARDASFCTHALLADDLLVVEDTHRDPRFADNPQVADAGVRFYAGAPLTSREGFRLGTLSVLDHVPRMLGRGDRARLTELATLVLHEMELRRHTGIDMQTGLYTRRFFTEIGGRELIRARRDARPLTAAFIAADPRINDTPDHATGDAVLCAITPVCRQALRGDDLLGRQGGADLVLLLPATSLDQALPVLERLRRDITSLRLAELQGGQVTVRFGAAELAPEDLTLDALLARAAKASTRGAGNRVALAA